MLNMLKKAFERLNMLKKAFAMLNRLENIFDVGNVEKAFHILEMLKKTFEMFQNVEQVFNILKKALGMLKMAPTPTHTHPPPWFPPRPNSILNQAGPAPHGARWRGDPVHPTP